MLIKLIKNVAITAKNFSNDGIMDFSYSWRYFLIQVNGKNIN